VLGVANDDAELAGVAMSGAVAFAFGNDDAFALVVQQQPIAGVRAVPAHADHLGVFLPGAEGVVGGVNDDEAALAFLEALFEVPVDLLGPARGIRIVAVVIADDHVVLVEVDAPLAEAVKRDFQLFVVFRLGGLILGERLLVLGKCFLVVGVLGLGRLLQRERDLRRSGDIDGESTGVFERLFHHGGGLLPAVIVLPVDEDDADFLVAGLCRDDGGGKNGEAKCP